MTTIALIVIILLFASHKMFVLRRHGHGWLGIVATALLGAIIGIALSTVDLSIVLAHISIILDR